MGSTTEGPLWTREAIICAIQRWVNEYGDIPGSKLWGGSKRPRGYPNTATVKERFGSWNAAIRAAGYTPRPRGVPGHIDPEYTIERFVGAARRRANA